MDRKQSYFGRLAEALRASMAIGPSRAHWIDCVKGITILLVVFHHIHDGVDDVLGLSDTFEYY